MNSFYFYGTLIGVVGTLSAVLHGIGLLPNAPWHFVYSDIIPFYDKAVAAGLPYLNKLIEYPVLTGLFVHFMGIIGGNKGWYYFFSAIGLVGFAGAATFILYKFRQWVPIEKSLLSFWIFAPSMAVFLIYNWDVIAVFFVIAAFYFVQRGNHYAAAALLAFGFSSKFYPAIYLVPLVLAQKPLSRKISVVAIFIATALLINGFFMIANWEGWAYFFIFNNLRNANPDSIWAAVQLLTGLLKASTINIISFLSFGVTYSLFLWRFRTQHPIFLSLGGTMLFLLFNKVFSPQYILWLLPFFVLMPPPKRWFYLFEFSNLAALLAILAWLFLSKEQIYAQLTVLFVLIRHFALFILFLQVLRKKIASPLSGSKMV